MSISKNTCKYFVYIDNYMAGKFMCRRYPPIANPRYLDDWVWPDVKLKDWCGEFVSVKDEKENDGC